jgi:hypothetical protein
MQRQRLLEVFNDFCHNFVADNVPAYQRRDLRRAFMAGAASMYKNLLSVNHDIITPQDMSMIEDVQEEMAAYAIAIQEGRE